MNAALVLTRFKLKISYLTNAKHDINVLSAMLIRNTIVWMKFGDIWCMNAKISKRNVSNAYHLITAITTASKYFKV